MLSTRLLSRSAPLHSFARRPSVLLTHAALSRRSLPSPARNFSSSAPRHLPQSAVPWRLGQLHELGLASYFTPIGWIQTLIEAAGVVTGLPAWAVVPMVTIATRLLVFPWIVQATQENSKLLLIQPQLLKVREQTNMRDANSNQAMMSQIQKLYQSVGYQQGRAVKGPIAQAALGVAFFFGVRKMCDLPLEQFQLGGLAWFADLSVADPYYILPALSCTGFLLMNQMAKKDMPKNQAMPHASNWIQVLIFASFIFIARLPSGLTLQMATNAGLSLLQQYAFRFPALRSRLGVPPLIPQLPGPTMLDTFKSLFNRQPVADAAATAARNVEKVRKQKPGGGWQ